MRVLEDHLPPPPRDVVEPAHFENGPEPQITGLGTGPDDPAAWLDIDSGDISGEFVSHGLSALRAGQRGPRGRFAGGGT